MLEWTKEILRKRRYSVNEINDQSNFSEDNFLFQCVQHMLAHFRKLFSYLIRCKSSQSSDNWKPTVKMLETPQIDVPANTSQKQQLKITSLLYRRLKAILANFQYQFYLDRDFDQIFNRVKNSFEPTVSSFFGLCCYRIIEQINQTQIDKQKKKIVTRNKIQILQNERRKVNFKDISQNMCETIYNNLELERIEACYLFIEGLNTIQNTNLVAQKQKSNNKKARKQINAYKQQYEWRKKLKQQKSKIPRINTPQAVNRSQLDKKVNINMVKGFRLKFQKIQRVASRSESIKKMAQSGELMQPRNQRIRLQPIKKNNFKQKLRI